MCTGTSTGTDWYSQLSIITLLNLKKATKQQHTHKYQYQGCSDIVGVGDY